MDIELPRTFLEIVSTGSFIRASERPNVGQTTVSARIRNLEQQLGRPLFIRHKGGASLTPAGEQFLRHAPTFVQLWQRTLHQVGGTGRAACSADGRQRGQPVATAAARLGEMDAPLAPGHFPSRACRCAARPDQPGRIRVGRRCDHVCATASGSSALFSASLKPDSITARRFLKSWAIPLVISPNAASGCVASSRC